MVLEVSGVGGVAEEVESVFIAVPVEFESGKSTVLWALKNLAKDGTRFVIAHVHPTTAQMVATCMGEEATVDPHGVSDQKNLRAEAEKKINEYVTMCREQKVCCDKLIIEKGDVAKGLQDLIILQGITKLVMGAAADESYSEQMESLDSKKAITLFNTAAPSCKIWFTCKGHLICTREANTTFPAIPMNDHDGPASASKPVIQHRGGEHYYDENFLSPHEPDNTGVDAVGYDRADDHLTAAEAKLLSAIEKITGGENLKEMKFALEGQIKNMVVSLIKDHKDRIGKLGQQLDAAKNEAEQLKKKAVGKVKERVRESFYKHKLEDLEKEQNEKMASLIKDCQVKLERNNYLRQKAQQERDAAIIVAEGLRQKISTTLPAETLNTEFSFSELEQATQGFNEGLKISEGVYKGFLRNTTVAIKLLAKDSSMHGQSELFNKEVAVLGRMRHPNLVTLIGACPEVFGLVYEFLPNGSLEDRLARGNNTPPLTWQVRTSIIGEMWSALTFLHSNKPDPVVHGDVRPANILLDDNLVSKLRCFLRTSELAPLSDTYFFGIIILRLLTGRSQEMLVEVVKNAMKVGKLHTFLDRSAGDWPLMLAEQLARIALRCAEMSQCQRPDLAAGHVWKEVETLMNKLQPFTALSQKNDEDAPPRDFLCPIYLTVMVDPHFAADGFTYDLKAITKWLDMGKTKSPMTGLELDHKEITPNRALKSAITEWKEQRQRQRQVRVSNLVPANQENLPLLQQPSEPHTSLHQAPSSQPTTQIISSSTDDATSRSLAPFHYSAASGPVVPTSSVSLPDLLPNTGTGNEGSSQVQRSNIQSSQKLKKD